MRGLEVNERVQLGTRALRLLRERVAQVEILRRVVERVEVVVHVSIVPSDGACELAVHDLRKGVDDGVHRHEPSQVRQHGRPRHEHGDSSDDV